MAWLHVWVRHQSQVRAKNHSPTIKWTDPSLLVQCSARIFFFFLLFFLTQPFFLSQSFCPPLNLTPSLHLPAPPGSPSKSRGQASGRGPCLRRNTTPLRIDVVFFQPFQLSISVIPAWTSEPPQVYSGLSELFTEPRQSPPPAPNAPFPSI